MLPLVAAGLAAAGALAWWWEDVTSAVAYQGLEPPKPPPAPAAPTPERLKDWTPEDMFKEQAIRWEKWKKTAIPTKGVPEEGFDYVTAAALFMGLYLLVSG